MCSVSTSIRRAINLHALNKLQDDCNPGGLNCLCASSTQGKHAKKRRRGVRLPSFVPVIAPRNKLYPIGVLVAPAPEPEVSTRITPDWSVKYIFCPVVAAVIGLAVIV